MFLSVAAFILSDPQYVFVFLLLKIIPALLYVINVISFTAQNNNVFVSSVEKNLAAPCLDKSSNSELSSSVPRHALKGLGHTF